MKQFNFGTYVSKDGKIQEPKIGDSVIRILAGSIRMPLKITDLTDDKIICGWWEFSRKTGGEIDEDLGWDGIKTGSVLEHPTEKSLRGEE